MHVSGGQTFGHVSVFFLDAGIHVVSGKQYRPAKVPPLIMNDHVYEIKRVPNGPGHI